MDYLSGDYPSAVLDQYLGGEKLKELILEEGNISNNDLPRTSHIDAFYGFQIKNIKNVLKYLKIWFIMLPLTSRIKNATQGKTQFMIVDLYL